MSQETKIYLAKKFFPHLRQDYGVLCVEAAIQNPSRTSPPSPPSRETEKEN